MTTCAPLKKPGGRYAKRNGHAAGRRIIAAAYAGEGATAVPAAAAPRIGSVEAFLARQALRDGELILLILKPSRWFIILSTLPYVAAGLILLLSLQLGHAPYLHVYLEAVLFALGGCLTWGTLQWMGRLYVLTDQRLLRLSGVFNIDVYDCPLRKVARTRPFRTVREQAMGLGSIEIIPSDEKRPCAVWQTLCRPREVNEQIQAAIRKCRQGGVGA